VTALAVVAFGWPTSPASAQPPPEAGASPCAEPDAWAAAAGARVVHVDSRWRVAILPIGGPYAVVGTDRADFIVARVMNLLNIDHNLFAPWKGDETGQEFDG